jgi:F-type H+-transporting ATPase subunit a
MFTSLAQIPLNAEPLPGFLSVFTNSILVAGIVTLLIVWLAQRATARMELVPSRPDQNIFEAVVEALYSMVEGIVGKHMVARTFPLLATLFLFILLANWIGLVPGVGTIGFGSHRHGMLLSLDHVEAPLFRPANADLNMTLGMALIFSVYWLIWSYQELGVGGIVTHIFGPKGGLKGFLAIALLPIFIFVGIIEVVSIAFRPVSLSLRLFGNVYAGENLMHTMADLGHTMGAPAPLAFIMSVLVPLPFYFLEILVGIVQALVFTLLCAVYIQLMTSHEGEDHGEHDGAHTHEHPADHAPAQAKAH